MTGEPLHTASKERNSAICPSYINYHLKSEVSITLHCQLKSEVSIMFRCQLLRSSTNQEVFETHLYNQSSHYEKYG